jgi:hypothetical protein
MLYFYVKLKAYIVTMFYVNHRANMIRGTSVFYTLGEGLIISTDIQSRTRKDLVHYSRIVIDPESLKTVRESCDCEAGAFHRKC